MDEDTRILRIRGTCGHRNDGIRNCNGADGGKIELLTDSDQMCFDFMFDRPTSTGRKRVGIVDADLIARDRHRFPNLVCEKISGYWKERGSEVSLIMDYNEIDFYDEVYISKVFTDTPFPSYIKESDHIHLGGTGFFFDKAPNLPDEIEHHMPDYHLYDKWIADTISRAETEALTSGRNFNRTSFMKQFKEYEYAVGFLTRGCFRKCPFCVNQKYDRVFVHSPLSEFYSGKEKRICLLDDNFLGYHGWKPLLEELVSTGKPFKFKQGLDERLLTDEKCELLFSANYDGDFTFAFDNIRDYDLIHRKLEMIQRHRKNSRDIKFYVLVGFEGTDAEDVANAFKRIELLFRYRCLPYVMRYQSKNETPWKQSRFRSMYASLARWSNQPSMVKKKSFREYIYLDQSMKKTEGKTCASMQSMLDFEKEYPDIASRYFDMKYEEVG